MRAGSRSIDLHRPDKVLIPDGITKADLADYHREIAPFMLPHLRGRPLMLERHPDGVDGPRFMQKDTPDSYPEWIRRVEVAKEGGTVTHTVCEDTATLLYLVDQAALTLHRWQSRVGRIDRPDRLVFDLDPAEDDFTEVREAARLLHGMLDELGLPGAPMTTGSRGVHIVVPIDGHHDFDETREFAKEVADALAADHPDTLTTAPRKKDRGGRLYLDVLRNGYAQTAVVPYSVRAGKGAPVATPLTWEQLAEPGTHARRWTIADAVAQARTNPWSGLLGKGRALGPARRKLRARKGS
ncbi:non-homologous end-joining DNA ligase [Streptomyces sp. VRA16 Mangrove soil]|uniref:non-homologous end-joining DNA ligase n=1 Tax=Streptomyces sp. VRA16 Mangrove soil TaxID=2817434 RepID=UPI001A9DC830|nr:non-homologous end-joining DNA ligase [Streptomyces sp. VRA16 Mangrove soil]MBO1331105.1 non-homologous end-joining DNA ligase [Streptomyces sp. VRA16 Mangrove soil]